MPKTKRALVPLYLLFSLAACLPQARLLAADADNDGLDDDWESANGLNPAKTTVLIYIDAANGSDMNSGQSAAAAKASLGGALSALQANAENAVMVAPGTYSGPSNRGLSVSYADLKILPSGSGAAVFDLGGAGRLLSATDSVFGMRGVTVRDGYAASGGTAVDLSGTSAVLDGCSFEDNLSGRKATYTYGNGETHEYWTDANGTAAVKASGGALSMTGCVFTGNGSLNGGVSDEGMMYMDETGSAGAVFLERVAGASVTGCAFTANQGGSAGAVLLKGSSASMSGCRFRGNYSAMGAGGVAVLYLYDYYGNSGDAPSSLSMADCLLLGGRSTTGAADLKVGYGCTLSAVHCTAAPAEGAPLPSVKADGTLALLNCIVHGAVAKGYSGTVTASGCCTRNALQGTGNISADPKLTGGGMLTAASPCIDAGQAASPVPPADINGTARPEGTAPDIGCHEFKDSDADGIPDFLEAAGALSPDGDADNDGVGNLAEYLGGTDPRRADSDGDGMPDGAELSAGHDPLTPTIVYYANPATGDDANGTGLTPQDPVRSIGAALALAGRSCLDVCVSLAPGVYSGASNRGLDFEGFDRRIAGPSPATCAIDLEGAGSLLSLRNGESLASRLQGVAVRNGYSSTLGTAVTLEKSALTIRDCVFSGNMSGRKQTYTSGDGETTVYYSGGDATAAVFAFLGRLDMECVEFTDNRSRGSEMSGSYELGLYGNCGALFMAGCEADIRNCVFGRNEGDTAGAVMSNGCEAVFTACRFTDNMSCSSGGAIRTANFSQYDEYSGSYTAYPSDIRAVNCLFRGNRSRTGGDDFGADYGGAASLAHCTLMTESRPGGSSLSLGDALAVRNSVVCGVVELKWNGALSASGNCTAGDWSAYGNGNLSADPKLTGDGMLLASSPCIGLALAAHAAEADMFGNARDASPDAGCHEFADADGNGIADCAENGLALAPGADADGDGLANLQEYLLGTRILAADTDGDGIPDGAELSAGHDPLKKTVFIHVAPGGSDGNAGLSASAPLATFEAAAGICADSLAENVILLHPGRHHCLSGGAPPDLLGHDFTLEASGGAGSAVVDLRGRSRFLKLEKGETARIRGVAFADARSEDPVFEISSSTLRLEGCRLSGFRHARPEEDCMHGEGGAAVLKAENAACSLSDTVVEDCVYVSDCSLFRLEGSTLAMERCSVERCGAAYGHVVDATSSSVDLVNTMFLQNNTGSSGQPLMVRGQGAALAAVNSTFAFNGGGTRPLLYGYAASVSFTNSIVLGGFEQCSPSFSHCCLPAGSAYSGTGCVKADPLLSRSGFLAAGSPCIDAGLASDAPADDRFGTPRPAGNGVDIGAEEFADSDGDGMSDLYEALCGGGLAPGGDLDGDGLTNLQEFLLGTRADRADTDGDGMPDAWEASHGLDPLSDDASGDLDGDGLSNLEECKAGTRPDLADTDGDGRDDAWEVLLAFSDPLAADFDGGSQTAAEVSGAAFTSCEGWEADGGTAVSRALSGWLEFTLPVQTAGVYLLEADVSGRLTAPVSDDEEEYYYFYEEEEEAAKPAFFTLSCTMDGLFCAEDTVSVNEAGNGALRCLTPLVQPGNHTVRIVWTNARKDAELRVTALRLVALSGPDSDQDGLPDWAETRLDALSAPDIPSFSHTSPLSVEGPNAAMASSVVFSGFHTEPGATPVQPRVRRISFGRWQADVPLAPSAPTQLSVAVAAHGRTTTSTRTVAWTPLDVADMGHFTLRKGDELLLTSSAPCPYTLTVDGVEHTLAQGESLRQRFDTAGTFRISAAWTDAGGTAHAAHGEVTAMEADLGTGPVCKAGVEKEWRLQGVSPDVVFEADAILGLSDLGGAGTRWLYINGTRTGTGYVTARLPEGGAVLSSARVETIETESHMQTGWNIVVGDCGDGVLVYEGYINVGAVLPGMKVTVRLWAANSLFEDGTGVHTFTEEDFDEGGGLSFSVFTEQVFSTCMSIYLYVGDVLVHQLQ